MLSIRALVKICGYGTFGLIGVCLIGYHEVQGRIRNSNCYIEAFQHLYDNEKAVEYFGEPLKVGHATNFNETENQSDNVLWYRVPLKGANANGVLNYRAEKDDTWFLSKVELEFEKLPNKKFVVMEKTKDNESI